MLPQVAVGWICCAQSSELANYRSLIGDEVVEQCGERLLHRLDNPDVAEEFRRTGWEQIRQEFLLPRVIWDELRLNREVTAR